MDPVKYSAIYVVVAQSGTRKLYEFLIRLYTARTANLVAILSRDFIIVSSVKQNWDTCVTFG